MAKNDETMMDNQPVQYLVHAALRPRLEQWLAWEGFRVDLLPVDDDSLPTYLVAPSDDAMRHWAQQRAIEAALDD